MKTKYVDHSLGRYWHWTKTGAGYEGYAEEEGDKKGEEEGQGARRQGQANKGAYQQLKRNSKGPANSQVRAVLEASTPSFQHAEEI